LKFGVQKLLVEIVVDVHGFLKAEGVIVGDELLIGSCDGIMVLVDTEGIHHPGFGAEDVSVLNFCGLLINGHLSVHLTTCMKVS
jgi:hypothetical protein